MAVYQKYSHQQQQQPNDEWTCLSCTLSNPNDCLACQLCNRPKPNGMESKDIWTCGSCTFQNPNNCLACQLCNAPKNSINPLIPLSVTSTESISAESSMERYDSSYWICQECTYCNNSVLNPTNCDLCDAKRQNKQTDMGQTLGGGYDYDYNEDEDDNDTGDNDLYKENFAEIVLPKNPTYEHFETCLNIIVSHSPNHKAAITVLKSLNKITSRVSDQKPKYRVLDTRTSGVQTKLLGFDGALEYLQLLGYSLDATQTRLQCLKHPPQHLLDEICKLIELHLENQRSRKKRQNENNGKYSNYRHSYSQSHKQQQQYQYEEEKKEEAEEEDLKLDCGDFTLTQLVGLVTHETLNDEVAIKVLLLCHRCFSSGSLELIEAIRKRFFVPAPIEAQTWDETKIIHWCQSIQRPIQNKCIQILCDWITNYFYCDFCLQPKVHSDLLKFTAQVSECKYESDDGWYDSLSALLTSAIENGQQQLDIKNINNMHNILNESDAVEQKEQNKDNDDDEIDVDVKEIINSLNMRYDAKKSKKIKIFGSKSKKSVDEKKIFYQYSARSFAEQITLSDFYYFSKVHSREFLDKVWKGNKKEKGPKTYPNLTRMIDRFNEIHKYVISAIVICDKLSCRVLVLSHFIDVCFHFLELRNFYCLMAVFSALDSIKVRKFKYMWLRLDNRCKSLLKNLSGVCDANSNFKALRKLMRQASTARVPTIPYIGVFLSDLTFVNEGAAKLVEGFINFKRFERFNERCRIVQSFQEVSYQNLKLKREKLCDLIEGDINILCKLSDKKLKLLAADAVKSDEKSATNSERQQIKMQGKKNKRRRFKK